MDSDEYEYVARMLGINQSVLDKCMIRDIQPRFIALHGLVGQEVNLSELQFLMQRLDSLDGYELKQFHAVVLQERIVEVRDMINATYNLSQYTVVDDLKDLEQIGIRNYFDLHGEVSKEEAEQLDFEELGRDLLDSQDGIIRSMGILYRNDVEIQQPYNGRAFPPFASSDTSMVMVYVKHGEEQEPLYLPSTPFLLKCAVERVGGTMEDFEIIEGDNLRLPEEIYQICIRDLKLNDVNEFCQAVCHLKDEQWEAMKVIACYKELGNVMELTGLARNIDEFQVLASVTDKESYGRYLIQQSGDYEVDQVLWPYFDYRSLGEDTIEDMEGEFLFTDFGAVVGKMTVENALDYKGEYQVPLFHEPEKFTELTLFSPLKVFLYEDGKDEEPVELVEFDLLAVQIEIQRALEKENLSLNPYRGLMAYFDRNRSVAGKVFSAFPGVQELHAELFGVLTCQLREPLSEEELRILKNDWIGQAADGYGEGFEQREITCDDGVLSVSLWSPGPDYFVMTEDELCKTTVHLSGGKDPSDPEQWLRLV